MSRSVVPLNQIARRLPVAGRISPSDEARFWSKVERSSDCWLYTGFINPDGYGHFWMARTNHRSHRVAWQIEHGPIPPALTVDHLCRVRHCVRPSHLRLCTIGENVREGVTTTAALNLAKTHCPLGHPYAGENLRIKVSGARVCRTCTRMHDRRRRAVR